MTDMDKIMAVLNQSAVAEDEQELDDAACGFEQCNPDSVDAFGRNIPAPPPQNYSFVDYEDDDEEEENEYDNWVADTYSSYDEGRILDDLIERLERIRDDLLDDDTRYYHDEYDAMCNDVDDLRDIVDRLEGSVSDYSSY